MRFENVLCFEKPSITKKITIDADKATSQALITLLSPIASGQCKRKCATVGSVKELARNFEGLPNSKVARIGERRTRAHTPLHALLLIERTVPVPSLHTAVFQFGLNLSEVCRQ